jgi:hypothetical protein
LRRRTDPPGHRAIMSLYARLLFSGLFFLGGTMDHPLAQDIPDTPHNGQHQYTT